MAPQPVRRISQVTADDSFSECVCGDRWDAANHQAVAVRHHDSTGHQVTVVLDKTTVYGDGTPPDVEAYAYGDLLSTPEAQ